MTLFNEEYQDYYSSLCDPVEESLTVFVKPLETLFLPFNKNNGLTICEVGFGLGRNFLCFLHYHKKNILNLPYGLDYVGLDEKFISKDVLQKTWKELNLHECDHFLDQYHSNSLNDQMLFLLNGKVRLHLRIGNAIESVKTLVAPRGVHGWMLDGFAPEKNPKMWDHKLLKEIAYKSASHAKIVTYSAARLVKDSLQNNGFRYYLHSGHGKKRHRLEAFFTEEAEKKYHYFDAPFLSLAPMQKKHIAIVGAGLGAHHLAIAFKKRNIAYTIYKKDNSVSDTPPIAALAPHFGTGQGALGNMSALAFHYAFFMYKAYPQFSLLPHYFQNFEIQRLEKIWKNFSSSAIDKKDGSFQSGYLHIHEWILSLEETYHDIALLKEEDVQILSVGRNIHHYRNDVNIHHFPIALQKQDISSEHRFIEHAPHQYTLQEKLYQVTCKKLVDQQHIYFQGLRTKSDDSVPLMGPHYDGKEFYEAYHDIHHGHQYKTYLTMKHPMQYLFGCFGGRGLLWTPIGAEIIASMLQETLLPIRLDALKLIHPMRFLYRKMQRRVF